MARFAASGWDVFECDGHDPDDIDRAHHRGQGLARPRHDRLQDPYRASGHAAQDTAKGHGALTDAKQLAGRQGRLWLAARPLRDPRRSEILVGGRRRPRAAARARSGRRRFALLSDGKQAEFTRAFAGELPKKLSATIKALKKQHSDDAPKVATRRPARWRSR